LCGVVGAEARKKSRQRDKKRVKETGEGVGMGEGEGEGGDRGDRDRRLVVLLRGREEPARLPGPLKGPSNLKAGGGFVAGVPSTPAGFSAAPARGPGAATSPLSAVARGGGGTAPGTVRAARIRDRVLRGAPKRKANTFLRGPELFLVARRAGVSPQRLTAAQACAEIARMGGHLKNNGEPGWLVLSRGYQDLLLLARGWTEAMAAVQAEPIGH